MFWLLQHKALVLLFLILLIVSTSLARQRRALRVPAGLWGGVHILMRVGTSSATIEYDCASGTIDGPLTFDSKGRFNWRGTHKREGPGPIRLGRLPTSLPAVFSGSVTGDTMTLTVKLGDTNQVLEAYTLTRGSQGRVRKCK